MRTSSAALSGVCLRAQPSSDARIDSEDGVARFFLSEQRIVNSAGQCSADDDDDDDDWRRATKE